VETVPLVRAQRLWLALAALVPALPLPPSDAEIHIVGAGFVTLLIFGSGVRLLPGFARRDPRSPALVWPACWPSRCSAST
jgi:hypothetical protein